ncbi:hypothetical protein CC86DRAFT_394240 [Ophiobolus disseminans]|uniref:Suppressor of anucleate metulae protein B n=1 Tax=Ophiobolus disseminans TaxID=1469910 RepID=A0A6A6ZYQ0_9PLEO|nr:hypothetical protein CC86DRAFT_394240 [Ophiobolus disseminans]
MEQCAREDRASLDEYIGNRSTDSPGTSDDQSLDLDAPGGSRHGARRGPLRPLQAFNVSANLVQGCAAPGCSRTKDLSHCSCDAVQYCRRKHQMNHRQAHRSICSKVKKAYANLEKEERALKRERGDNVFENYQGVFWSIYPTRDYMRARFMLVEALLKINTSQAVTLALDHLLGMLHLCRIDTLGVREVVPSLYLRLGRDQEAYDFCSWYHKANEKAEENEEHEYDWEDRSLPFLNTTNADIFGHILEMFTSLSHVVATTLLKIRLIIDIQCVQRAKQEAGPHVPREILDNIQEYSTITDTTGLSRMLEREDQRRLIAKVKKQVNDLYAAVEKINRHFWPALIEPGDNLRVQPTRYTYGDEAQMQLVLQYNYNSWAETPGAIGVIEELSRDRGTRS